METPKIELKKVSTFNGRDGVGLNAQCYIDGVYCFDVHDAADGGCYSYTNNIKLGNEKHNAKIKSLIKNLEDWIAVQPKREMQSGLSKDKTFNVKVDMDMVIDDAHGLIEYNNNLKKYQKKGIVIGNKETLEVQYFNLKKPLSNFNNKQLCAFLNTQVKKECEELGFEILNLNLFESGVSFKNGIAQPTSIRFAKKGKNKSKTFWVEDYNLTEMDFFLNLGFKETKIKGIQKDFGIKNTLDFDGSAMFGAMSQNEWKTITDAVKEYFNIDKFKVYEYQLHELL